MTYKKIISFLSLSLFIIIVFWAFVKPQFSTKKASFNGTVVSITKKKRSDAYDVRLKDGLINYVFIYNFMMDTFDIKVGDSVFKKSNDKILYVRTKETGEIKPANEQDFLVPPGAKTLDK
ncbi:hypothetical protein [Lacibacter sp. H407]|jgi:hypothetical protein|uniref:hypothetical protein n=1 Tax=Lacibacter sp. H407 TaxID=3133423 RepID=UPI0030C60D5A